jgi:protein SCO1/2
MVRSKRDGMSPTPRKSGPDGQPRKAYLNAQPLFQRSSALWIGIVLAAVVLAGGAGWLASHSPPPATDAEGAPIGGPFHLLNQDGQSVDQHILNGRWSAVFFGYTYCPDTCPATLQALGAASRQLHAAPGAPPFQVVFISVDPARDTPSQMKLYLQSQGFPAGAIGLTGSPEQVAAAAKAYGVYYAKAGTGVDYTVDHSAAVYLMDPKGRFARPLSHDMEPALIAQQITAAETGG